MEFDNKPSQETSSRKEEEKKNSIASQTTKGKDQSKESTRNFVEGSESSGEEDVAYDFEMGDETIATTSSEFYNERDDESDSESKTYKKNSKSIDHTNPPFDLKHSWFRLAVTGLPKTWTYMQVKTFLMKNVTTQNIYIKPASSINNGRQNFHQLHFHTLKSLKYVSSKLRRTMYKNQLLQVEILKVNDPKMQAWNKSIFFKLDNEKHAPTKATTKKPEPILEHNIALHEPDLEMTRFVSPTPDSAFSYDHYGLNSNLLRNLSIKLPLRNTVYVTNLSARVTKEKLREVFGLAGNVQRIWMVPKPQGDLVNAWIEYDHPVEAAQAISMLRNQTLYDLPIHMYMSTKKHPDPVPIGLSGIGPGFGKNSEPLKGVRTMVEMRELKRIVKELTDSKDVNNRTNNVAKQPSEAENLNVQNNLLLTLNALQSLVQQGANNNVTNLISNLGNPTNLTSNFGNPTNLMSNFGNPTNLTSSFGNPTNITPNFGNPTNLTSNFENPTNLTSNFGNSTNLTPNFGNPTNLTPNFGNPTNVMPNITNPNSSYIPNPTNLTSNFGNLTNLTSNFGNPNANNIPNAANVQTPQPVNIANSTTTMPIMPQNTSHVFAQNNANMHKSQKPGPTFVPHDNPPQGFGQHHFVNTMQPLPPPPPALTGPPNPKMNQDKPHFVPNQSEFTANTVQYAPDYGRSLQPVPKQDQQKFNAEMKTKQQSGGTYEDKDDKNAEKTEKNKNDMLVFSNLPASVTVDVLNNKMREVGDLMFGEMTGDGRAFVRFKSIQDAERCLKLFHRAKVDGQLIQVSYY